MRIAHPAGRSAVSNVISPQNAVVAKSRAKRLSVSLATASVQTMYASVFVLLGIL